MHERAKLNLYVNKFIDDEPHLAFARDISVTGMYVCKLLEPPDLQISQFAIEVQLPESDDIIWVVAERVREEQVGDTAGVGLRFVRIADYDRWLIQDYIAKRRGLKASEA